MFAREGFAYGRTNNEGYNNSVSYIEGMPVQILLTGSLHMNAQQIMREDNTASILYALTGRTLYNIGIPAHNFITCAVNLEFALKKYTPSEYVIIETAFVNFSDEELERILSRRVSKLPAYDKGIASLIRRNCFLRLMYHQFVKPNLSESKNRKAVVNDYNSRALLAEVLSKLKDTASSYDVNLIIAYHPFVSLNTDGTLSINGSPDTVKQFSELCAENGIYFLDISNRFLSDYENQHVLPYGFMNTSVGKGHMNKYGHRIFAEEIYKLIQRIEAQS